MRNRFQHRRSSGLMTVHYQVNPDLLIIDEMGMEQLPGRSGECLVGEVLRRYEARSTMMTSEKRKPAASGPLTTPATAV